MTRRRGSAADRIAKPGDPDLDADIRDLTITAVVCADPEREILLRMTGGHGGWVDRDPGRWADGVQQVASDVRLRLPSMPDEVWREYVAQLERWRDHRTPLRMCAAPGKVSTLIESRDVFLPLPRRRDPLETGPAPGAVR